MRKYLIFCLFVFCIFDLMCNLYADSDLAEGTIEATLKRKLTITKGSDLAFGNIAFVQGGSLTMDPSSGAITGGTSSTVDSVSGTGTPGTVDITGPQGQSVSLTYPNTINLAIGELATGATITGLSFISGDNSASSIASVGSGSGNTSTRTVTLSSNGTSTLKIGGTLNITNDTISGLSEGLYTLTVTY